MRAFWPAEPLFVDSLAGNTVLGGLVEPAAQAGWVHPALRRSQPNADLDRGEATGDEAPNEERPRRGSGWRA